MLSIPATKGFEIGSGFEGTKMRGSEHNDMFDKDSGECTDPTVAQQYALRTKTNFSGGIQGGISNGETISFRVAFKPPATIGREQSTTTFSGEDCTLEAKGRHDPCVVNRAVPIVEGTFSPPNTLSEHTHSTPPPRSQTRLTLSPCTTDK